MTQFSRFLHRLRIQMFRGMILTGHFGGLQRRGLREESLAVLSLGAVQSECEASE
jgi:hypothetical protein